MTCAKTGVVPAARALLEAGASVDAVETWRGQTALMWAAAEGHADMVRALIAAGADKNARSTVLFRSGRLLAYLFADGKNVNVEMVRRGWSRFDTRWGEGRFAPAFRAAEREAERAERL
jgi:ankyrin repeat protein